MSASNEARRSADGKLTQLVADLVRIESVNPDLDKAGAGEKACARFVGNWLTEHGIDVEYQKIGDERENVVAMIPGRGGGGRSLMLNAHLDTVALGGMTEPLHPRESGGRLYGRGALDTKAGLAACMLAAVAAHDESLRGDVIFAAVADEECRSKGTEALLNNYTADAGIVSEPTQHAIVTHHKGYVWLEIQTHGVAAHGSDYLTGVDAITAMGPILTALKEHQLHLATQPGSPTLGPPSLHASLISGGTEMSTYPDLCRVHVEHRMVDGESPDGVREQIQALVNAVSDVEADVRVTFSREPLSLSPTQPIVETITRHWQRVTGTAADVGGQGGWTDAALMTAAGVPSTVFGPQGQGLHGDDEWVDLASLATVRDVIRASVLDFCA